VDLQGGTPHHWLLVHTHNEHKRSDSFA